MRVNGIDLHLRPQSFFQTNTEVAAALYRQAAAWVDELGAGDRVGPVLRGRRVRAARRRRRAARSSASRSSAEAVGERAPERARPRACRRRAVRGGRRDGVRRSSAGARPDLVVVNPPRRGHRRRSWPLARGVRRAARPLLQLQRRRRSRATWPLMPSLRPRARAGARHVPADHALRGAGPARAGLAGQERDDLVRRTRLAQPREDPRHAVLVRPRAGVGHRVDRERHVEPEVVAPRGRSTPRPPSWRCRPTTTWVTPSPWSSSARPVRGTRPTSAW